MSDMIAADGDLLEEIVEMNGWPAVLEYLSGLAVDQGLSGEIADLLASAAYEVRKL